VAWKRSKRLALASAALVSLAIAPGAQAATLRTGDIIVADVDAVGGDGAVIKVNPRTGEQSVVASNATSALDLFQAPIGIAIDRKGTIFVADNDAFAPDAGADGGVIRVNPRTGELTPLVDGTEPGAVIDEPDGLAFSPKGFLAVADFDAGADATGALVKVTPRTGTESLIADPAARPDSSALGSRLVSSARFRSAASSSSPTA
jgi:sugar lactone lactonase YvrE